MDGELPIPMPVETIRLAFEELKRAVTVDLNTQRGDAARLDERKRHCLRLLHLLNQVRCATTPTAIILTD